MFGFRVAIVASVERTFAWQKPTGMLSFDHAQRLHRPIEEHP